MLEIDSGPPIPPAGDWLLPGGSGSTGTNRSSNSSPSPPSRPGDAPQGRASSFPPDPEFVTISASSDVTANSLGKTDYLATRRRVVRSATRKRLLVGGFSPKMATKGAKSAASTAPVDVGIAGAEVSFNAVQVARGEQSLREAYRRSTKSAAGAGGSVAGTAIGAGIGSLAGPPGILVGGFLGGMAGELLAEHVAGEAMGGSRPSLSRRTGQWTAPGPYVEPPPSEVLRAASREQERTVPSGTLRPYEPRTDSTGTNPTPSPLRARRIMSGSNAPPSPDDESREPITRARDTPPATPGTGGHAPTPPAAGTASSNRARARRPEQPALDGGHSRPPSSPEPDTEPGNQLEREVKDDVLDAVRREFGGSGTGVI